jgi:type 1 glutamine amidotransferase
MKQNILRTLATAAAFTFLLRAAAADAGFQEIFNGKDLTGWDGNRTFWSVKDGVIVGQTTTEHPTKGNTFLVWTNGPVADFELRFAYKITPNNDKGFGNSGVQYRSQVLDQKNWVVGGYQADFEAGNTYSGILYEERMRGILAERGQKVVVKEADGKMVKEVVGTVGDSAEIQAAIKKDGWNDYIVIARGNHLQHFINGRQTVDVTDEAGAKAAKSGVLALQLHAGQPMTVQFKEVRLKTLGASAAGKKIVFIAGRPSHGPGEHEHRAGCLLLQSCLDQLPGITTAVYTNGWPDEPATAFAGAAAVVVYADGGGGHPFLQGDHLKTIGALMEQGVGLAAIHYACEPTKDNGQKEFLDWIGGAFEIHWSVNPHWDGDFTKLPNHPIATGVNPFMIRDEWYFHIRFPEGMKNVTPILSAVPPASTMERPDGTHSGNPAMREAVKRGDSQHVAWAAVRDNGGRGFGFTGAHFHQNWGNDDFRKLVLNAILWTAKVPVPAGGVACTLAPGQLEANLDPKAPRKPAPKKAE